MRLRSSPIVLLLFALMLMGIIAARFTIPRFWGNTFRTISTQEQDAQKSEELSEVIAFDVFEVSEGKLSSVTIKQGESVAVFNHLSESLELQFALAQASSTKTTLLHIEPASNEIIEFETSGEWNCTSNIIHSCGSIYVESTEVH